MLQTVHCCTNVMASAWRDDHQKRSDTNWSEAVMPGCPELGASCTRCSTLSHVGRNISSVVRAGRGVVDRWPGPL